MWLQTRMFLLSSYGFLNPIWCPPGLCHGYELSNRGVQLAAAQGVPPTPAGRPVRSVNEH